MKAVATVFFAVVIFFILQVARTAHREKYKYDIVADGFVLVTNRLGEWACAFENTMVICESFEEKKTRQNAINRSWSQYERGERLRANKWSIVEEK